LSLSIAEKGNVGERVRCPLVTERTSVWGDASAADVFTIRVCRRASGVPIREGSWKYILGNYQQGRRDRLVRG